MSDTTDTLGSGAEFLGDRLRPWIGMTISVVVAALFLIAFWGRMVNHDTAWYLLAAEKWLAGGRLYVDIQDVNPPLNFYFSIPVVLIAKTFGITPVNGQYLTIAALLFVCLVWSWAILSRKSSLSLPRQSVLLASVGAALILPAIGDIAQREHVLVVLLTPWLVSLASGDARDGILPAAVAALGVCLKPFFVLFPLCVTLWRIRREGSLRPVLSRSNLVMLAVGAAYVIYVQLVHSEYFSEIVPLARSVHGAIGRSDDRVLVRLLLALIPFVPVLLIGLAGRKVPSGTGLFLAAAVAGMGCYLAQWSGFSYHLIHFETFATLACIWIIAHSRAVTPVAIGSGLAVVAVAVSANLRGPYDTSVIDSITSAIGPSAKPESVFVASTFVNAGPPLALALGARWASRHPHNWLAPGGLNGLARTDCQKEAEACAAFTAASDKNRDDNLRDIDREQPDIVVIDKRPGYILNTDFSWYEYYGTSPEWERIRTHYRKTASTEQFDILMRCNTTDKERCTDFDN